jgi:hypothetical protein
MPTRLNLSGNGILAPAGGYPLRLWAGGQMMAEAVLSKDVTQVTATVYAEAGIADAHLAIYAPPSTSSGSDNGRIEDLDPEDATIILKAYQTDEAAIGQTATTLVLDMPTNRERQTYVLRLWVDNITGLVAEEVDRDIDGLTSDETLIPTGVYVTAMEVA